MHEGLKIGDILAVTTEHGRNVVLSPIERITDKYYVCANHTRFRKADLRSVRGDYTYPKYAYARLATEADYVHARIKFANWRLNQFIVTEKTLDITEKFLTYLAKEEEEERKLAKKTKLISL